MAATRRATNSTSLAVLEKLAMTEKSVRSKASKAMAVSAAVPRSA